MSIDMSDPRWSCVLGGKVVGVGYAPVGVDCVPHFELVVEKDGAEVRVWIEAPRFTGMKAVFWNSTKEAP